MRLFIAIDLNDEMKGEKHGLFCCSDNTSGSGISLLANDQA